jgi:hypothetical protein
MRNFHQDEELLNVVKSDIKNLIVNIRFILILIMVQLLAIVIAL